MSDGSNKRLTDLTRPTNQVDHLGRAVTLELWQVWSYLDIRVDSGKNWNSLVKSKVWKEVLSRKKLFISNLSQKAYQNIMQNYLSIMTHGTREKIVRSSSPRYGHFDNKLLKKRLHEFGEAGGVIGMKGTFPQSSFTNLLRLNWTKLFFSILDNSQLPEDMKTPSLPDDDVDLRNESRFTTTNYSESDKMKFHASHQSRFW